MLIGRALQPFKRPLAAGGTLVAGLVVLGFLIIPHLPASITRHLVYAKWGFSVSIALAAALAAYNEDAGRARTRVLLLGAVLAVASHFLDVPKVPESDYDRLKKENANADKRAATRLREIARVVDRSERNPFRLAQAKLAFKEYRSALSLLDRTIDDLEPTASMLAEAHFYRGLTLYDMDSLSQAVVEFDKALQFNDSYVDALVRKCEALRKLEWFQEALSTCEDAIRLDRESAAAWNAKGGVLVTMFRDMEALAALEIAIRLSPENPRPLNNKALALWNLGRLDEALTATEQALALWPDFTAAQMTRTSLLRHLGRYDEAIRGYEALLSILGTDPGIWLNYGNILLETDRMEEAIKAYRSAAQLNPQCENALYNWGNTLLGLERYEEAIAILRDALKLEPEDFTAWHRLSVALRGVGRGQEAEEALLEAKRLNPDYETAEYRSVFSC